MGMFDSSIKQSHRALFAQKTYLADRVLADPSDTKAVLHLCRIDVRCDRPIDVLVRLKAPSVQESPNPVVHRQAAEMLLEVGALHQAVAQANKGRALGEDARLVIVQARALKRLAAENALGVTAGLKRTYIKAMQHLIRRRPAEAAGLLEEVVAAAPRFYPAWIGLRGALEAKGDVAGARALADRWVAADPGSTGIARIAMARRLSPDGLLFDRRLPAPLRSLRQGLPQVASLEALAESAAGFVILDAGGEFVTLDPVISSQPDGSDRVVLEHKTAKVFMVGIDNAALVGRGAVVDAEGGMVRELHALNFDKYGIVDVGDQAAFDASKFNGWLGEVKVYDTPALLFASATDKSFGDWMLNFVPRLMIARAAGLTCPIVVSAHAPKPFLELLRQLGVPDEDIILHDANSLSLFRKLYIPSWPLRDFLRPMAGLFDIFQDLVIPATNGPGRRLYLSREHILRRDMVNEAEVSATFERHGFEVVHPQELSLTRMRELLSDADYVAAPYGSALLNLAMAGRKPKVIVCMPPLKTGFLKQTALWLGSMGLQFAYVTGRQIGGLGRLGIKDPDWMTPIDEIERVLAAVVAEGDSPPPVENP